MNSFLELGGRIGGSTSRLQSSEGFLDLGGASRRSPASVRGSRFSEFFVSRFKRDAAGMASAEELVEAPVIVVFVSANAHVQAHAPLLPSVLDAVITIF